LEDGLVTIISRRSARDTMDALVAAVTGAGLTVFARIDHSANAAAVGLELRPTELLMFGNPSNGTVLMQDEQSAGLDLPFRALAWEDENGEVWLTYNDPHWIGSRHELSFRSHDVLTRIESGIAGIARAATGA
jgi:uncharacterized protein (DUF302 family)